MESWTPALSFTAPLFSLHILTVLLISSPYCLLCVCVCVQVCMHTWVWMPKIGVCYLLQSLFTLCFDTRSLISHELIGLVRLAGQYVPGLGLQAYASVPVIDKGAGDLNTGPHAYAASILLTEPCSSHCTMVLILLNNAYILLVCCSLLVILGFTKDLSVYSRPIEHIFDLSKSE